MRAQRSIRSRRARRRIAVDFDLQLTSMLDILVIVLVFLLKAFASTSNLATPHGLQLPLSESNEGASASVQVVISRDSISVENQRVVFLEKLQIPGSAVSPENPGRVLALQEILETQRERLLKLRAMHGEGAPPGESAFVGSLAIHADRSIPYQTLKKVLYTSALAGFKSYRLVAVRK